ncbi:MAG TPA: helix-turn-helix domain-containing protein [Chitinophagaceae bacterium]|nr:helix-turn-helix domain-containing protein [Chitinophagaceae bacterium]
MRVKRHIEFIHRDHFENNYHRYYVQGKLSLFIDFFWQTKFEKLWPQYPQGFSDALFPNLGYTYLINLGTPFVMQVENRKFNMKTDGFLPRPGYIECFHQPGNVLFGIKLKVSPVIFEKKVDFGDYKGSMFPLSYLLDHSLLGKIKNENSFDKRVQLLMKYYEQQLNKYEGSLKPVNIVTSILENAAKQDNYNPSIEGLSIKNNISSRTLQRYFLLCTGVNSKNALQILRIRQAINKMLTTPGKFHFSDFGYYDFSHFYKHLKQFLHDDTLKQIKPHLQLLQTAKKKAGKNTGPV